MASRHLNFLNVLKIYLPCDNIYTIKSVKYNLLTKKKKFKSDRLKLAN
jgi:hypothetical protein